MPETTNGSNGNGAAVTINQGKGVTYQFADQKMFQRFEDMVGNALMARQEFFSKFLDPRRNLEDECGYPGGGGGTIGLEVYQQLYDREAIAARVVQVYPKESWQVQPLVYEDEDADNATQFEGAWDDLGKQLYGEISHFKEEKGSPVWEYLRRADELSGIGQYGVILLGLDDGKPLHEPAYDPGTEDSVGPFTGQGTDAQYSQPLVPRPKEGKPNGKPKPGGPNQGPNGETEPEEPQGRFGAEAGDKKPAAPGEEEQDEELRRRKLKGAHGPARPGEKKRFPTRNGAQLMLNANPFVKKRRPGEEDPPEADEDETEARKPGALPNRREQFKSREDLEAQRDDEVYGTDPGSKYGRDDAARGDEADPELGPDGEPLDPSLDEFGNPVEEEGPPPWNPKVRLLFLRVFPEQLAQITQFETNVNSPRFGHPTMYLLTFNDPREQHSGTGITTASVNVHWTRVIHVADISHQASTSEVFAVPRQRPVLNRLLDLRKLYGGSAEMYWRGAFPGFSLETHPQLGGDVNVDQASLRDMMENWANGLQRYLALMGMSAKSLAPQVVDPTQQIMVQIEAICIKLGVPKRVFMGSERGELASSQDDAAWNDRLRERQNSYITPRMIVPFVDRLIALGVLPEPADGYCIEWPDLSSQTETEKAQVAGAKVTALAGYISGGVEALLPPQDFLTRVMGFDEEEASAILENASAEMEEKRAEEALMAQDQMDQQQDQIERGLIPDPSDPEVIKAQNPFENPFGGEGGPPGAPPFGGKPGGGFPPKPGFGGGGGGGSKPGGGFPPKGGGGFGGFKKKPPAFNRRSRWWDRVDNAFCPGEGARDDSCSPENVKAALAEHAKERRGDMPLHALWAKMKALHPKMTKEGWKMRLLEMHRKGDVSLSMWSRPPDEIPDKTVVITKQEMTGRPDPLVPGRVDYYGYASIPRRRVKANRAGWAAFNEGDDCGTGAGGFQQGNTCAGGGSGTAVDEPPALWTEGWSSQDKPHRLTRERRTAAPRGTRYAPSVTKDADGDGVTEAARVGVPAHRVPPPPQVGRLPNLTPHERAVEEAVVGPYNMNPEKMAKDYRAAVLKSTKPGEPPKFETDAAKELFGDWMVADKGHRSVNRATLNHVFHQAANGIAKRAFLQHLDTMQPGQSILVTVGGCGSGKGFALKQTPEGRAMKAKSHVVWDSAGDQNASENPWIQGEAERRGLKVNYLYVHADPWKQWSHPERGVVKRAAEPDDGRMVLPEVYGDSHAIGAKNHEAFYVSNRDNPNASFLFLENRGTEEGGPRVIDGIPRSALTVDRKKLTRFARKSLKKSDAPAHVKRAVDIGLRLWDEEED